MGKSRFNFGEEAMMGFHLLWNLRMKLPRLMIQGIRILTPNFYPFQKYVVQHLEFKGYIRERMAIVG